MAHEILSVKLCQMDDQIEKLHGRIHMSELADQGRLRHEIENLKRECAQEEFALRGKLQHSRSAMVSVLAQGYEQMEQIAQECRNRMQALTEKSPDVQDTVEGKLLLAEYALDFAHQAANRALLVSMEAIDAQMTQQKGRTL